jgi:hypothetical protein
MCSAKKFLFLLLALFSFLLTTPLNAETNLKIPVEYGEIIYRFNEKSPNQIFIIGIRHRDALTCLNGDNTSRVQAEAYKIGDWLIHIQSKLSKGSESLNLGWEESIDWAAHSLGLAHIPPPLDQTSRLVPVGHRSPSSCSAMRRRCCCLQRTTNDCLRFLQNASQMILSMEALGVNLVDILRP